MSPQKLTGLVLAGGQGSRYGGQDKGLIECAGRPLVSYALEVLEIACDEVMISANRNLQAYSGFGHPVVQDRDFAGQGPLSGLLAGLTACRHEHLLIVPCDTPLLPKDLGRQLLAGHDGGERSVCVASDGEYLQPGCALIPKRLRQDLHDFLAAGERRLGFWLRRQQYNEVVIKQGAAAFLNLNSPEEMQRATEALQR